MIPKFINRKKELEFLEKLYEKKGFKLFILYGRRRVGKTELLKSFLENKNGAYILATDESIKENIKEFKNKFYDLTKKDYFLNLETSSFYDLFKYLIGELKDKKLVVVIDEFPYLLSLNKGILSTFQKIADELLKNSEIMLILCGSSLSIMENDILGYKSPLYGRDISSWKLLPFDFNIVYEIIDKIDDAMKIYFIFGNIPYYLKFYNKEDDLFTNIRNNFLTKGLNLYDEPLVLLRQEFKESRTYRLIIKYISLGYKTIGKICSITGMDKSNIMKYLSTLEETNIIKHILPFGMKRKGYYEIIDPLFRFWFKFIYSNRDKLEIGNVVNVEESIKKELNSFFGISFEYLIEELINHKLFIEFSGFSKTYKWWYKDKEIDVISLNDQAKEILFCECKWQSNVNAKKVLEELKEKSKFIEWNKENRKEYYAIFAKSFREKIKEEGLLLFDLKDIENVLRK